MPFPDPVGWWQPDPEEPEVKPFGGVMATELGKNEFELTRTFFLPGSSF